MMCSFNKQGVQRINNWLKYRSARDYQLEVISKTDKELLKDGHPQDISQFTTYHKIASETKRGNRLLLSSRDLSDLFQYCIKQHNQLDPYLRYVASSSPLYRMPVNIVPPRGAIIHFEATGCQAELQSSGHFNSDPAKERATWMTEINKLAKNSLGEERRLYGC
ncbi:unnamed protein product [Acanthoscelides obtectus]|uniref:Uncharacterized protein n=1 Tax=Acanthoscelides obtectus TaxID=200917 RepID=A0A9P0M704_ACAOB|nr:unnamed protein product [Acanthoscelides obtectus]CAK1679739.1 hypothetical protein AOBTE_LOCUS32424 [Acanthoscelides obtectus]